MNKGAHFYNVDFQVHTPVDINWSGKKPKNKTEWKEFATKLIKACRDKGLDSIAVTDHHTFEAIQYIKQAAQEETDTEGNILDDESKLIIYPGCELTLEQPPCQAILILDADFPLDLISSVLGLLGIDPKENIKTVQPINKSIIGGLDKLQDRLDAVGYLKGRYIVLPNVSENGHQTLLRSKFSSYYRTMPCVGGYVDGAYPSKKNGRAKGFHNIVSGKDKSYGNKKIGVIQTSDNRSESFDKLGQHSTWIKWAEPTAEALRQACLASDSRITFSEPVLPSFWIGSLHVSNSKFFGPIDVELNAQFNTVIGGRGTGKSTLLEYIRWALCDLDNSANDSIQEKRNSLIENTLLNLNGEVKLIFYLNGVRHVIKRNKNEILLKVGSGIFEEKNQESIKNLFPIQAYSQKQLSSVGVKNHELRRFITAPISKDLQQQKITNNKNTSDIIDKYQNLIRKRRLEKEIKTLLLEKKSINEQLQNLRKSLKGLTESDKKILELKSQFSFMNDQISQYSANKQDFIDDLDQLMETLQTSHEYSMEEIEESKLKQLFNDFSDHTKSEIKSIVKNLKSIKGQLSNESTQQSKIEKHINDFEKKYKKIKTKAKDSEAVLEKIKQLEQRLKIANSNITALKHELSPLGDPEKAILTFKKSWIATNIEITNLLQNQCNKFQKLSNGRIKAEVKNPINSDDSSTLIQDVFRGTGIREDKIKSALSTLSKKSKPYDSWLKFIFEIEKLISHDPDIDKFEPSQLLSELGFVVSEQKRLSEKLNTESIASLMSYTHRLTPKFFYVTNVDDDEVLPFEQASAGQQATALLTVLLNQDGFPLIIDQPEDDLDSDIDNLLKKLRESKSKRQIIFVTHNANLAVNGDADLVLVCKYKNTTDQTRGKIAKEGSIDCQPIRNDITKIMEGGKKAFNLRKEKYGF